MLDRTAICTSRSISYSAPNSPQTSSHISIQGVDPRRQISGFNATARLRFSENGFWHRCRRPINYLISRGSSVLCRSSKNSTSSKEVARTCGACSNPPREQDEDEKCALSILPLKIIDNDAKFVNKRAQSDIVLLSRGILCLDARARQDVALLGSEFLKLDARAREDTEKIDNKMKKKAERLHHIAMILKDKAKSRLKTAADRHWSDGALEADLRLADSRAKRRAMEDTLMALEFVKNIHDMMISKVYKLKIQSPVESIMLERNGKTLDSFPGEVSNRRVEALQEAYWSMASALSEADGIDYTDPEELELLITTLIDLDAMDGKSSVSLLAECSSSPDVETRRALANALAAAPSMWTLGNAGMGALQRLAEDSNPAVADAASRAIYELKRQWEIEEGDSWRFTMYRDSNSTEDVDKTRDDDDGAC